MRRHPNPPGCAVDAPRAAGRAARGVDAQRRRAATRVLPRAGTDSPRAAIDADEREAEPDAPPPDPARGSRRPSRRR